MDLNIILLQLQTDNEEDIERLLHQYNGEVGGILRALTFTQTKSLAS
jgi:hypothetical protein